MSTGHTTYTTFHADSVGEVIKRFTTDPINVSKTLFTALDLVSIQTQTRVGGHKVRRNKVLTEINEYAPENDEINVRDVYEWRAETDNFIQMGSSSTLEEIKFDRGWQQDRLNEELFKRKVVLAYLIENGLNTYTEVAATVQAFINDPETILTIIAQDHLERSLEDLQEMESVKIDIDPEKEKLVPRPEPTDALLEETSDILDSAEPLFEQYREMETDEVISALEGHNEPEPIEADDDEIDFGEFVPKAGTEAGEE
jgi:flagellar protein FlaI